MSSENSLSSVYHNLYTNGSGYSTPWLDEPRIAYALADLDGGSLIDIGCGRGVLVNEYMRLYPDAVVKAVDFENVEGLPEDVFVSVDLENEPEKLLDLPCHQVTCTDVLEHIDEDRVPVLLSVISRICDVAFVSVANHSDFYGGVELHKTQRPKEWWDEVLSRYFLINGEEVFYNGRSWYYQLESIAVRGTDL